VSELTGRELDAEVARVVFGYKVEWRWGEFNLYDDGRWTESQSLYEPPDDEYSAWLLADHIKNETYERQPCYIEGFSETDRFPLWGVVPEYHANMTNAWLVMERMAELGYWWEGHNPFSPEDTQHWAAFIPHGIIGLEWNANAWTGTDTESEAICLAALVAIKAEDA